VTLKPRDNARFMQRWWLERQTGLLLRADVVNDRGEVLESAAFTELQLGARVPVQALLVEMNRLDGYRVNRSRIINTDLEREGWTLRSPVAGFRPVQCVQRLMAEPGPRGGPPGLPHGPPSGPPPGPGLGATQGPNAVDTLTPATGAGISVGAITPEPGGGLVQAIYSDGLTHVSIFIEGFRLGTHAPEPMVAMGATYAIVRRQGDWWITVVGDVPPSTLRQFAQALERRKP
jgi:sigma-E factor negative regulatory protein RseB